MNWSLKEEEEFRRRSRTQALRASRRTGKGTELQSAGVSRAGKDAAELQPGGGGAADGQGGCLHPCAHALILSSGKGGSYRAAVTSQAWARLRKTRLFFFQDAQHRGGSTPTNELGASQKCQASWHLLQDSCSRPGVSPYWEARKAENTSSRDCLNKGSQRGLAGGVSRAQPQTPKQKRGQKSGSRLSCFLPAPIPPRRLATSSRWRGVALRDWARSSGRRGPYVRGAAFWLSPSLPRPPSSRV